MTPFNLTPTEKTSAAWTRISAHVESRLASLRMQNDGPLDDIKTAHLRGQIAELKRVQAWANELPPKPADDE